MNLPSYSYQKSVIRDQQKNGWPKSLLANRRSLMRLPRGFTLIELLVVIAVITILISIGFPSFSRTLRQARDSQRHTDARQLIGALEQFYSDYNRYPLHDSLTGRINDSQCSPTSPRWGIDPLKCGGRAYLPLLPRDPGNHSYYYSSCGADATRPILMTIFLRLENPPAHTPNPACPAPAGITAGNQYNFVTWPAVN